MEETDTILYPESHLNSPIVGQRLVTYLTYSHLPHNQVLKDETALRNIRLRSQISGQPYHLRILGISGQMVLPYTRPPYSCHHIPYPECNKILFNYVDDRIAKRLDDVLAHANSAFSMVSQHIAISLASIRADLGLSAEPAIDPEALCHDSIIKLPEVMTRSQWYHPFLFWFTLKTEMRACIKKYSIHSKTAREIPVIIRTHNNIIVINRFLTYIINLKRRETYYLTFEIVLMLCDVVEGRMMCDVAMCSDPKYGPIVPNVYKLWSFIDGLFQDLGNRTYNVVSLLEPLTLGFLQLRDESPILAGAFLDHSLNELIAELNDAGYTHEEDQKSVLRIVRSIFNIDSIHLLAEMFSFFRSFGHPILEAENAANKVRDHMHKPKLISFEVMMKGHAIFCGTIINGFRDRHGGVWPPVTLPDHCALIVKSAQLNNEALTDPICITNWKSFCGIRFGCFMPLSLDEDLTMYMKDKALAALKKEWDSAYPIEVMPYRPPKATTSRRLIDVFVSDPKFDPYEMIQYVLSGDYLEDKDFNLSYSLKEKETKQVGRLFAKMTYKMRACQVIAENLIANGVGKYFKDNGMAKDEHELAKTLHRLSISAVPRNNALREEVNRLLIGSPTIYAGEGTGIGHRKPDEQPRHRGDHEGTYVNPISLESGGQYETISTFLTTDLQKFCLNWRAETINVFAQRLDEIYGLQGFFQWLHRRLERSVLYVCDPYCPPGNLLHIDLDACPDEHIFIKYPMGGIEGFCQKLWTIATIPYLYLSAYEVGVRISSVVQGDNEAIAITKRVPSRYPYWLKKEESSRAARLYFHRLRENLAMVGHNLKANETVISSHFFIYSKQIYYDGVALSQSLKAISRCVFWSETIVDETRSACSNIATSLAKAIEKGYSRNVGYGLCLLKTVQQLMISLDFTINPFMTHDIKNPIIGNKQWLLHAALTPAPLGGFNYMNMSRLYVRNIGDPLTASLADVKRLMKSSVLSKSILQKVMNQEPGDSSFLDWANDPYSANIPNTQSITKMLKNITARNILVHSPNPMLRGLFHNGTTDEDQELARFLMDRRVIIPRAAHEIIDNSMTGAREHIAGMLDSTKGFVRSGLRVGGLKSGMITKIATYDIEQFRRFNQLMAVRNTNPLIDNDACSVSLAQAMRQHMWQNLSMGRLIYGLEVPDILELCTGTFIRGHEDCCQCISGNQYYGWFFTPSGCDLDAVGRATNAIRVPYIGSTTEERSDLKVGHIRNPSKALKAAIRIATIYTWAYGDTDESWHEAWTIANQRANLSIDDLKLITPISTSTNLAHRMRDKSTQVKYSSSSLNRVARYTTISNDNLSFMIDGVKVDTNYVYQQGMLLGLSVMEDHFRFDSTTGLTNTVLHLHVMDSCCLVKMEDHPNVGSRYRVPVTIPPMNNKLVYDNSPIIERDQLRLDQQRFRIALVDFTIWSTEDLSRGLAQSLAVTLIDIITKAENDHLNEIKAVESDDDISSLIAEFLIASPKLLSLHLGQVIAVNWAFEIHYRRPRGRYQMVELLHTLLSRMSKGSLNILVNAFSHPRVFRRMWDADLIEPRAGHLVDQQNLVELIRDYLVECYSMYLSVWESDDDVHIPYMICEPDEDVLSQRYDVVQSKHLAMISDLYVNEHFSVIIRGLDPINKCRVLRDSIDRAARLTTASMDWNIEDLTIFAYPASVTYIRRGTIKQLRLRMPDPGLILQGFITDRIPPDVVSTPHSIVSIPDELPKNITLSATEVLSTITSAFACPAIPNLSRQAVDYSHHLYRRLGINSTSCYKALEIANVIAGRFDQTGQRLFLGEGSGAMLVTYYYMLGNTKCYYNTGVFTDSVRGQREFNPYPSEVALVGKQNSVQNLLNDQIEILFNGKPESTWIGNLECYAYILNQVKIGTCSMVHCDMEGTSEKTRLQVLEELCHVVSIAVATGAPGSVLVLKLMPLGDDWMSELIKFICEQYEEVFLHIPWYSNPDSTEMYVIAINLKISQVLDPGIIMAKLSSSSCNTSSQLHSWIIQSKSHLVMNHGPVDGNQILSHQGMTTLAHSMIKLTPIERTLATIGFQQNGTKVVKQLIANDPSNGIDPIIAGIVMAYKELLYTYSVHQSDHHFFQPYPVLDSSKVREVVYDIIRKTYMVSILDSSVDRTQTWIDLGINLRKRVLPFDFHDENHTRYCPHYVRVKLLKSDIKRFWLLHMTPREIKLWWKAISYSFLV
ncbi:L protein [Nariva virus]|uniref:RNA-directed RNA polymerase L n=1 Tax=Nariva virus TaxID=590647 RepID=B8XH65_9MONO|nr:L protein [Nariva virus]ACL97360.2 L protein [Nariva virus]